MLHHKSVFTFIAGFGIALGLSFNVIKEKRVCAIELSRCNMLYTGVYHPATIVVSGVPDSQVVVTGVNIVIDKTGPHQYIFKPISIGDASVFVKAGDFEQEFKYRVSRFPDPNMRIGGGSIRDGSNIVAKTFMAQGGITAQMTYAEFSCGNCLVISYDLFREHNGVMSKGVFNQGGRYNAEAKSLIDLAEPDDIYYYENIRVRCPGDVYPRDMGSMRCTIK
jgi:hypothetical protein